MNDPDLASKLTTLSLGETGSEAVLVVDFVGTTTDISAPLAACGSGISVLLLDAVTDLAAGFGYQSMDDLVRGYVAAVADGGHRLSRIVGNCSGAALAVHLADRLQGKLGWNLPVTLVTPSWPTMNEVVETFDQMRQNLAATDFLPFDGDTSAGPVTLLETFGDVLVTDARAMAAAQELDEEDLQELLDQYVGRYRAWLSFLLASAESGPGTPPGPLRVICGQEGFQVLASGPSPTEVISLSVSNDEIPSLESLPRMLLSPIDSA